MSSRYMEKEVENIPHAKFLNYGGRRGKDKIQS